MASILIRTLQHILPQPIWLALRQRPIIQGHQRVADYWAPIIAQWKQGKLPHYTLQPKQDLPQGKVIPAHDHLDHEIYFTIVRGEVKTILDGVEEHRLSPGTVLSFPGEATISIEALVDSEFFVYLIKR